LCPISACNPNRGRKRRNSSDRNGKRFERTACIETCVFNRYPSQSCSLETY
jgi:hypothetical protein